MIAMMAAANRPAELRVHLKGALKNGCTPEEIREILLLVALYCGIPAANEAHRAAMDVLQERAESLTRGPVEADPGHPIGWHCARLSMRADRVIGRRAMARRESSGTESTGSSTWSGSAETSWEDAGQRAVETAATSLRDLRIAEVTKMDMRVENGKVARVPHPRRAFVQIRGLRRHRASGWLRGAAIPAAAQQPCACGGDDHTLIFSSSSTRCTAGRLVMRSLNAV